MNRIGKYPFQKRLEITNWLLLALLFMGSFLFHSNRFSLGILLGGLISVINFHWLHRNLLSVITKRANQVRSAILWRYCIRLAVTAVALYLVISRNMVDIIGLLIGLSIVVLNLVLTTMLILCHIDVIEEF